MSELFDSLNLSTSAGPSSSQQSSSQPSTSKVFWHASPSPGVLRQLQNRTPNKSQESPTLPLCTQAFVGELKKLPGVLEAQSPLLSRGETAKRKLHPTSRHVSDPTANRGKVKECITLDLSDDDEEEAANQPRRLLLGDAGESSPESRRRRTMDAGHTGRVRESTSPSQHSSAATITLPPLPPSDKDPHHTFSSHRRLDRRPPRRRKKESFMAGLGFTDDSGRPTDCLKLFEDLQAAIQGMNASRPSTSGSMDSASTNTDKQHPSVTFDHRGGSENGRLTPREGISRTNSAPSSSSRVVHSQGTLLPSSQQQQQQPQQQPDTNKGGFQSRRVFRPVKSDHDVFRAASGSNTANDARTALQPRTINVSTTEPMPNPPQSEKPVFDVKVGPSLQQQPQHKESQARQERIKVNPLPAEVCIKPNLDKKESTAKATATAAQASPVKRSARIEAMQQNTHSPHTASTKKLGVRGPSSLLAKSSPRKSPTSASSSSSSSGGSSLVRKSVTGATLSRKGMSQARQPGLPRSCSQFLPSQQQQQSQTTPSISSASASQSAPISVGPAAPFRPPVRTPRTNFATTTNPLKPISTSVSVSVPASGLGLKVVNGGGGVGSTKRELEIAQPSSSDDSFEELNEEDARIYDLVFDAYDQY